MSWQNTKKIIELTNEIMRYHLSWISTKKTSSIACSSFGIAYEQLDDHCIECNVYVKEACSNFSQKFGSLCANVQTYVCSKRPELQDTKEICSLTKPVFPTLCSYLCRIHRGASTEVGSRYPHSGDNYIPIYEIDIKSKLVKKEPKVADIEIKKKGRRMFSYNTLSKKG